MDEVGAVMPLSLAPHRPSSSTGDSGRQGFQGCCNSGRCSGNDDHCSANNDHCPGERDLSRPPHPVSKKQSKRRRARRMEQPQTSVGPSEVSHASETTQNASPSPASNAEVHQEGMGEVRCKDKEKKRRKRRNRHSSHLKVGTDHQNPDAATATQAAPQCRTGDEDHTRVSEGTIGPAPAEARPFGPAPLPVVDRLASQDVTSELDAAFLRGALAMYRRVCEGRPNSMTDLLAVLEADRTRDQRRTNPVDSKPLDTTKSVSVADTRESISGVLAASIGNVPAVTRTPKKGKDEPMSPVISSYPPSSRTPRHKRPAAGMHSWRTGGGYTPPLHWHPDDLEIDEKVPLSDWSDGTTSPLLSSVDPECGRLGLELKDEVSCDSYGSEGYWSRQLSPDSPSVKGEESDDSATPELDFTPSTRPSSVLPTPRTPNTVRGSRSNTKVPRRFRGKDDHSFQSPLFGKSRRTATLLVYSPAPDTALPVGAETDLNADVSGSVHSRSSESDEISGDTSTHTDSLAALGVDASPAHVRGATTWRTYSSTDEFEQASEGSILFSTDDQSEVDELDDDDDEKFSVAGSEDLVELDRDTLAYHLEADHSIPPLRALGDTTLSSRGSLATTTLIPIRWFSRDGGERALSQRIMDATGANPRIRGASAFLGNPKRTYGITGPVRKPAHGILYPRKRVKVPEENEIEQAGQADDESLVEEAIDGEWQNGDCSSDEHESAFHALDAAVSEEREALDPDMHLRHTIETLGADFSTRMIAHASHACNLACADGEARARAKGSIIAELKRARALGYATLVVHPGSYDVSKESCRNGLSNQALEVRARRRLVFDIREILQEVEDITLAFENMPCRCRGQVGTTLDDLKTLIEEVDDPHGRLQICIDLNHVYTAQVDFTTPTGLAELLAAIDDVGVDNIAAFHLSDSGYQHGSAGDAHVEFGRGFIGIDTYRNLLRHPHFAVVPTIFEVPSYCTTFRYSALRASSIPETLRKLDDLNQELFETAIQMSDPSWATYGHRVEEHYRNVEKKLRKRIRSAAQKMGDEAYTAFINERKVTASRNRSIGHRKEAKSKVSRKPRQEMGITKDRIGERAWLGHEEINTTPGGTTRAGQSYGVQLGSPRATDVMVCI